jgi:hypothetical protein
MIRLRLVIVLWEKVPINGRLMDRQLQEPMQFLWLRIRLWDIILIFIYSVVHLNSVDYPASEGALPL